MSTPSNLNPDPDPDPRLSPAQDLGSQKAIQPDRTDRVFRITLIVLGAAAILKGVSVVLFDVRPGTWFWIVIYLAIGSGVHDLLIAPASLLFGRVLRRPLRIPVAGNAVRGAWLAIGTVLLVGLPLVAGSGKRANPTVIPGRPLLNIGLSLVLVLAGAGIVIGLSRVPHRGTKTKVTPAPAP